MIFVDGNINHGNSIGKKKKLVSANLYAIMVLVPKQAGSSGAVLRKLAKSNYWQKGRQPMKDIV